MRVSTQFPIAVHILLMIDSFPDLKITSEVLAESTGSNPVIIRGLFAKLKNAGLLETKSGRGKITVTRPAEEITLWDIYTAVESDAPDELFKLHPSTSETCVVGSNIHALLMPHLEDATAAIRSSFSKVTLAQLKQELYAKIRKAK